MHKALEREVDLISRRTVFYSSISPIEEKGDVEFYIPPDPECHLLLNQSRLEGYFVVKDDDGLNVVESDGVALTNHYAAAIFSQIEIYLNGTQVCDLSAPVSYPYKHNIDVTLSYPFSVSNYLFETEGYRSSERESEDKLIFSGGTALTNILDENASNKDAVDNYRRILLGKKVYFSTGIPADIFYSDKYLPPNVEVEIKLRRFNPKFSLRHVSTSRSFNICLQDVKLRMRKVLTTIRVHNRINASLAKEHAPCVLPYKDTQLKHYHIPVGSLSYSASFLNAGRKVPVQIVFALILSELLNRKEASRSPFFYQHCDISSVMLKQDGKSLLPRIMHCDFDNDNYVHMYDHFQSNANTRNRVTLSNYKKGYTFFCFRFDA